ncbi:MAG: DUF2298 domain-containing protein, partial [Chloroflexaceae bacterium]|nr:DUF2298 domain-containing protein [Chloroflexaceae bacterium]
MNAELNIEHEEKGVHRPSFSTLNSQFSILTSVFDRFISRGLPLLVLAGAITLLTFRVFQPDAFSGSRADSPPVPFASEIAASGLGRLINGLDFMQGWGFFDLRLDPRFMKNLSDVRAFVTGEIDWPPSHQWVLRTAYLFPWLNMVQWGMGPFLGLAAWLSFAMFIADFRLQIADWRRRTGQNLQSTICNLQSLPAWLLWGWIAFYFLWQGNQFAITLRYLLPIYGALIIFAAWGLVRCYDWSRQSAVGSWQLAGATTSHSRFGRTAARMTQYAVRSTQYLLPIVILGTFAWAYAFTRIYERPHSRVMAAQWLVEHAPPGSKIAFERWDDPLPLYDINGNNLWGVTYEGKETSPYAEDDPQKYLGQINSQGQLEAGLIDTLNAVDYLTLTSNRVYDSATRMPYRFPALTRYYHHLFNGDLGFELVADIHSYPRLLGIEIPDQRAEEAFHVYDHPRVLIFRKTAAFSPERAAQLITGDVNWGEVYKLPVKIADRTPNALRLTESQWLTYRDGGTWSAFFNPASLVNNMFVAPLLWLLVLEVLGLALWALLFPLLRRLPDRGFSLARALALLLVAYAAWLLGSLKLAPFTPLTLWACAAPLLLAGAWAAWRWRAALRAFWDERRSALLLAWGIYLGFFALGLAFRWFNPDLWHPARGGEKPMDFAFLNAVLKSSAFPPYDPWHAGGYINYYYFGFVLVGALVHLTTIVPAIAYNLAVPSLFALTALGAWGVVYNLTASRNFRFSILDFRLPESQDAANPKSKIPNPKSERFALIASALAPIFMLLLGNLAQALWFLNGYAAQQASRPEWAFWDATRIVQGTVNEFPFFTFLFADLHAHMIVMPFSLALLGLTVALVRMAVETPRRGVSTLVPGLGEHKVRPYVPWVVVLLLCGLLAGALRATNTWDYPTFVGLTFATLALLGWRSMRHAVSLTDKAGAFVRRCLLPFAVIVIVGNLAFLPFTQNFVTESSGVELLRDGSFPSLLSQVLNAERTSLTDWLRMYGLWFFLLASAGVVLARRLARRDGGQSPLFTIAVGGTGLFALAALAAGWPVPVLLIPLLLGAATLAWRMRHLPPRLLLPLLWAGTGLALSLLVEVVAVQGDVGRMNTVFKFGLHSWMLFALAAAVAVPWIWSVGSRQLTVGKRAVGRSDTTANWFLQTANWFWRVAAALLIAASLVYPLTATPARLADRAAPGLPRTFDGLAFMASDQVRASENGRDFPLSNDAAGIAWLQANVPGTPVIL